MERGRRPSRVIESVRVVRSLMDATLHLIKSCIIIIKKMSRVQPFFKSSISSNVYWLLKMLTLLKCFLLVVVFDHGTHCHVWIPLAYLIRNFVAVVAEIILSKQKC